MLARSSSFMRRNKRATTDPTASDKSADASSKVSVVKKVRKHHARPQLLPRARRALPQHTIA